MITIPGVNIGEFRESLTAIDNTPPHYITCYTDGSKLESITEQDTLSQKITATQYTLLHEASHRLLEFCSMYQAELTAIRESCNSQLEETNKHIIIWTDDLSSLMVIRSNTILSKTVADCLVTTRTITTTYTVELRWIAAHFRLWGTEKVDK